MKMNFFFKIKKKIKLNKYKIIKINKYILKIKKIYKIIRIILKRSPYNKKSFKKKLMNNKI